VRGIAPGVALALAVLAEDAPLDVLAGAPKALAASVPHRRASP